MTYQVIECLETREMKFAERIPNAWKLKPFGKLSRKQKAAWRFLQDSGSVEPAYDTHVKVTQYHIDSDDIMRKIFSQRNEVAKLLDREGDRLYIGSEDFNELRGHRDAAHYFNLNASYYKQDGFAPRLFGMKITVVPWMRGVLVVPKDGR